MKKCVNVIPTRDGQYAIQYIIGGANKKLISEIDSIIFRGQCEYYGILPDIPNGFSFNVTNATDCTVIMHGMSEGAVNRIGAKVADKLGVILNINNYEYV
jgi:hypothetical protein